MAEIVERNGHRWIFLLVLSIQLDLSSKFLLKTKCQLKSKLKLGISKFTLPTAGFSEETKRTSSSLKNKRTNYNITCISF